MKWLRKRKENRKREQAEPVRWRVPLRTLLVAGILGLAVWLVNDYLQRSDWEHFRALEVIAELQHVSVKEVTDALQPYLASGFAGIDIRGAQRALEAHPWIADAAIRRQWPGVLVVELREEKPVVTWFGTSLMNAHGEVFIDGAAGYTGVLPDIGGPAGTQHEMIGRLKEVSAELAERGLELRRLLRTERRAERLWLSNGIEVRLGRRETDARLQRFLNAAWPALQVEAGRVAYVDMRYTNGFAVGWKADAQKNGQAPGVRANVQENG